MPRPDRARSRSWKRSATRSCSASSNCGPSVLGRSLHRLSQLSNSPQPHHYHQRRADMATATAVKQVRQPKALPAPNSDFYQLAQTLNADELAVLNRVRAFMETKVAPIINKYWVEDAFPFELLPAFKKLSLAGV